MITSPPLADINAALALLKAAQDQLDQVDVSGRPNSRILRAFVGEAGYRVEAAINLLNEMRGHVE